jgi:RNA-dependent RNA polymerase
MELFMTDISPSSNKHEITRQIATALQAHSYTHFSNLPINFHVQLFRNRSGRNHSRQGSLTLPSIDIGNKFLQEYGGHTSPKMLSISGKRIKFCKSKRTARPEVVESIRHMPYEDPQAAEERESRASQLQSEYVSVKMVQFGWECRDAVYSVEWERSFDSCFLMFDNNRNELRIKIFRSSDTLVVAIRLSHVIFSSACISTSHEPVIVLSLHTAPSYEVDMTDTEAHRIEADPSFKGNIYDVRPRKRLSSLDEADHERIAPYTSHAIRLICKSKWDVALFRRQAKLAGFHDPLDFDYPVEYRGLFSREVQDELQQWLLSMPWGVAFQVESLTRSLVVDIKEALSLRAHITRLVETKGDAHTAAMLRHFAASVKLLFQEEEDSQKPPETVLQCFHRSKKEYELLSKSASLKPTDSVDCLHVLITPSSMLLEGPYPERSNRVLRRYSNHHAHFLRVSFVDEARLQYRFDREVDGRSFVQHRVGIPLLQGVTVAGRLFTFLAYSQSALKEHAVWFVRPFNDIQHGYVDAATIIKSLGTFENLAFDRNLIYCPARYGARISQAFTTTDASVTVEAEEIFPLRDITRNGWCFTDGVGTISKDMANAIFQELNSSGRRKNRQRARPRAYQVRFQGSKGMLSVDHTLSGRVIFLRDSMIKFDAPDSLEIEIARSFDRPGKYYLNRPLIMILEGLGVPYNTFKRYQDDAVAETQTSNESLRHAAMFLEAHGLGASFRLTSVMTSLDSLGVELPDDAFHQRMMEFAVHHVLRELKHRARIPVPGGWTLVGVADNHNFLREGQIFACVKLEGSKARYLEGPILISRSPTIHPGDVQVAHAIGKPPEGSCFAIEPLPNTVVFSTQG